VRLYRLVDSSHCVNKTTVIFDFAISAHPATVQLHISIYQPLRSPSEIVITSKSRVFGKLFAFAFGTGVVAMFMTPMTLLTCLQNDRLDPRQLHDRKKRRIDAIVRKSNYIGGLPHSARHAYRSNRRALCGNYLTAILCPQLLVITIVSNELYLLGYQLVRNHMLWDSGVLGLPPHWYSLRR